MSDAREQFIVGADEAEMRLDIFLSEKLNVSRSQTKKMVDNGEILVNGKAPKKAGDTLKEGSTVAILQVEKEHIVMQEHISHIFGEVQIIAETPEYLVVSKPAGLLVHETEAHESDTLASRLLIDYPDIAGIGENPVRPGMVHRLDKDASGLLVVARTQASFEHVKAQFKERSIDKYYTVLVYGIPQTEHGMIDFDIDRGRDGRMVSRPKTDKLKIKNVTKIQPGKEALTEFWVEETFVRFSLLNVKIHTGRMHQIRVHMFASNHPVVGDALYINPKLIKKGDKPLSRLFLHARELSFTDMNGDRQVFTAELPEELRGYLKDIV